jgi:hypothetical protein
MHKLFTLASIILLATACNNPLNRNTPNTTTPTTTQTIKQDSVAVINDPANNLNIQATNFSEIDTSGILLFPLSMGESPRESSESYYKGIPNGSFWNIVFYNTRTGEQHLLSDKKMLIHSYNAKYENDLKIQLSKKFIFYNITTEDFNGDKKFTNEDATYLFITDKAGNNLKQISPSNYNLQNWEFIASSNKIIMTLKKDSDKNKSFDAKDEITNFIYDMNKGEEAKEIFTTDLKNKLKLLYDKDWKKIKP